MSYSTNLLQSVAECDTLLTSIDREIRYNNGRMQTLSVRNEDLAEDSVDYVTEIAELEADLAFIADKIPVTPEGRKKENLITEQHEKTGKLRRLRDRANTYGPIGVLNKEHEVAVLNQTLEELNAFKTAVESRKSQLS